jgi:glycosyltransferase involved in cell wall biosynthesis
MQSLKTVALVTNIPTPYRVPLFRELDQQLRARGCRLVVVFGGLGYSRRLFHLDPATFGFDHHFLDGSKQEGRDAEKTRFLFSGLNKKLRELDPATVIVSGFSLATLKVAIFRRPFIVWNGSIRSAFRREGFLKRRFRKIIAAKARTFVAYGNAARDYLVGLKADASNVFIGINTVDTAFFSRETEKCRQQGAGGGTVKRLLTISYLSPRKGIDQLLKTIRELAGLRKDFILEIVGEGSERALLERYVQENGLKEFVHFTGHLQRSELPARLAQADLFLFQTNFDIWGLTVNEAMAAGLPVCCSPNAGCVDDLIHERETGFVVDYADPVKAAALLHRLLDQPELLKRVGSTAASFISRKATPEVSAQGFVSAVLRVLEVQR